MNNLKNYLIDFCRDEEGLTTVEYAVAGSLITAGVVGAFTALAGDITAAIDAIGAIINP